MPRLSLANLAVVALFALVVIPRAAIPLIDGDVWWHIRAGHEVLELGSVPTRDTWSIAGAGATWTSQDWLSNVALVAIAGPDASPDWGAMAGSMVFAELVALAIGALWVGLRTRGCRGWLGPMLWLGAGLVVAGPTLGVRVQVVDLTMGSLALLALWAYLTDRRRRWLGVLPLLAFLWANLHAGWVLLFLLGGAVVVGELVDRTLRGSRRTDALPVRQLMELAVALGLAAAAIAVNPNGLALYGYPLQTSLIAAHRDFLAEWSPPSLTSIVGQAFAAFVILGVVPAAVLGWRYLRSADLLVLIGVTVMAASAARFLLVTPIAAAVVALALDRAIDSRSRLPRARRTLERMARPPRTRWQARLNLVLAIVIATAGLAITMSRVAPAAQAVAIGQHMPVAAVDWLLVNDVGIRPFNTYSWGGYLGLRRPELPVYIDGRSDVYGDAPIREYAETVLLMADPSELLDRHRIDHVLFNVGTPFARWLDDNSDWERVYADDLAGVWVRRE